LSAAERSTSEQENALQSTTEPELVINGTDRSRLAHAARRDLVDGLMMWEMWGRMSWLEVKRRYRRTLLGPMWVAASLGIFAIVLSLVWASLFKQNVREYLPFMLSGLIPWILIAGCVSEACSAFISGEPLMKSRRFPYSVLLHVILARHTTVFAHNMITFAVAALFCSVPLTLNTLLIVPGMALLLVNLSWIALLLAILCLRYRDVQQVVSSIMQIALFITPVFWPTAQLTGRLTAVVDFNLLYHMIEMVRAPMLGKAPSAGSYLVCLVFAAAGWLVTYQLLARKRHRLVYWF
jgi:ABC-type polysaccharide/polyol phosphate export permease